MLPEIMELPTLGAFEKKNVFEIIEFRGSFAKIGRRVHKTQGSMLRKKGLKHHIRWETGLFRC